MKKIARTFGAGRVGYSRGAIPGARVRRGPQIPANADRFGLTATVDQGKKHHIVTADHLIIEYVVYGEHAEPFGE